MLSEIYLQVLFKWKARKTPKMKEILTGRAELGIYAGNKTIKGNGKVSGQNKKK